jgi:hypothetical protein
MLQLARRAKLARPAESRLQPGLAAPRFVQPAATDRKKAMLDPTSLPTKFLLE